MTAPDRDPVVAAIERIPCTCPQVAPMYFEVLVCERCIALPLARAMAALVAAIEDTEGACQNCLMLNGYLSACGAHRALADYRRALEAK